MFIFMEKIETTENYHRIPNPKHTESGCDKVRTIDVTETIKGLFCVDHKKIKTFLFDKDEWTMEGAKEWVKERTKAMKKQFIKADFQEKSGLFVASTEVEDREGDVLAIDGWDLKNFKKNPVLLWAHNNTEPPVATAERVGVRTIEGKKALVFKPKFHDITERAREIGKMVKEGIIKSVSVGFIPEDRDGNTFTKNELLEISFVPVPANPEALSLAYSKGIDQDVVKEVFEVPKENKDEIVFKAMEDLSELKKDIIDIKKSLGDIATAKKPTQEEGTANTGREPATANGQTVRRQAQIVQKAVESILREIKNG